MNQVDLNKVVPVYQQRLAAAEHQAIVLSVLLDNEKRENEELRKKLGKKGDG
jgi:hypothetical protein|nr:MAG TPA: hypothetical protein [Caudoviricetes sp.]